MERLKIIQYFLHFNKQKVKLGLRRTQQVHKVKGIDENTTQKVSNFNFLILENFYITFSEYLNRNGKQF